MCNRCVLENLIRLPAEPPLIVAIEEEQIHVETSHHQYHRRHPPHNGHGFAGFRRSMKLVHHRHTTTATTAAAGDVIVGDGFCSLTTTSMLVSIEREMREMVVRICD